MDKEAALQLQQKTVEHIRTSHAALDAAKASLDKQAAVEVKAAALIPAAVQKLIDHGRIYPEYAAKVAESLRDPVAALELLTEIANPATGIRQAIGTPAPAGGTKTASAKGPSIIDFRGRASEADARYEQGIAALANQLGQAR